MPVESILEPAGGSTESQRDLSPSSSSTKRDRNNWTTRSWNSWHSSRSNNSWKKSEFRDQFRLPGDKLPANRRSVWTEHPLIQHVQMRTVCQHITLHRMITFHHANTRGSRLQALVRFKRACHPRVMSRSLQHLTLTTSTSSLSTTNQAVIFSYTSRPVDPRSMKKPCGDSRRSGETSEFASPTSTAHRQSEGHHESSFDGLDHDWWSMRWRCLREGTCSFQGIRSCLLLPAQVLVLLLPTARCSSSAVQLWHVLTTNSEHCTGVCKKGGAFFSKESVHVPVLFFFVEVIQVARSVALERRASARWRVHLCTAIDVLVWHFSTSWSVGKKGERKSLKCEVTSQGERRVAGSRAARHPRVFFLWLPGFVLVRCWSPWRRGACEDRCGPASFDGSRVPGLPEGGTLFSFWRGWNLQHVSTPPLFSSHH